MTSRYFRRSGWRKCGFLVAIAFVLGRASHATGNDVESLHDLAWNQCLDSVEAVPAARYGFYAYRSLAVSNPGLYLQADQLAYDVLTGLPGSRLAYRSRDVRDIELYLRVARGELKGGSFGWGMMTLNPDSVFDDSPIRSTSEWFDLRAPSISVLLKPASPHLSTRECALLRYGQLSAVAFSPDSLFVVIDKKGAGYLLADTVFWAAGLSTRPVADWKSVSPVLVFNRRSVFSALTGRDDRGADPMLARLMGKLGKTPSISFNANDAARISKLNRATSLSDPGAQRLAILAASGLVDYKQPRVASAWKEYLGEDSAFTNCATLQLREIYFWANRLSKATAELASKFSKTELHEAVRDAEATYLSWAGRRVGPLDSADLRVETWGCLWSYDLLLTTIDDNISTRAGSSASQASAMSAVLDLAGLTHFQLSVEMGDKQIPDQEWLFADGGRLQFNLGVWTTVPDSLPRGSRPTTVLISGFSSRGVGAWFEPGIFCSRMDNLTLSGQLTRIVRLMPLATLAVVAPTGEMTPMQKFLVEIASDQYRPAAANWPRQPTG